MSDLNEWKNEWMNDWMNEWMIEGMNEWMNELMHKWMMASVLQVNDNENRMTIENLIIQFFRVRI